MSDSVTRFQDAFLKAQPAERFSMILRISTTNNDARITNLLSGLNVNDTHFKNSNKADNIYFVCQQLRVFPNFIY